jgi:hypothetical protein
MRELPRDVMLQLRNDLHDRFVREHHQHLMAARLYRNLGKLGMANYELAQAEEKLKLAEQLEDPMTDLIHLQEGGA